MRIALKQKFHFRLWFDYLDLRVDIMNISDRTLRDMGLSRRDAIRPVAPLGFN